jgi:hypothetical protein
MDTTLNNKESFFWAIAAILISLLAITVTVLTLLYPLRNNQNYSFYSISFVFLSVAVLKPLTLYWREVIFFLTIPILGLTLGCIALAKKNIISGTFSVFASALVLFLSTFVFIMRASEIYAEKYPYLINELVKKHKKILNEEQIKTICESSKDQ